MCRSASKTGHSLGAGSASATTLVLLFLLASAATGRAEPPVESITLSEAIARALTSDPSAIAAEAALSSARADRLETYGAWLPALSVGSGYSNSSTDRVDPSTGRLVSESYTAQATGSLLLFQGGRRIADQRAASAWVTSAEARYRSERYQTILRTTELFYATAAAVDVERLAAQRLERARQQLSFARSRVDVGNATASDGLRAELEMDNAELALLDARSSLRAAALELGRQIGETAEALPVEAALPNRAPALPQKDVLVARATDSSPSVLAARANLRAARAERWGEYAGYLPSLRLSGGYDWFAYDFPPDQRSWSVRFAASLPIFDGFQREAALRRSAGAERVADAELRDATRAARVDIETAVDEITRAERRVEISEHAIGLAEEDLRVLEERYQLASATILELQTSQVALTEAQISAVRARQTLGTAIARLEAILGRSIEEVMSE